jgi:hypothetical protein
MLSQSHPSPGSTPAPGTAASSPLETRTPEQKAHAKALKKERKHERLRFFFGWCEGCKAFCSGF